MSPNMLAISQSLMGACVPSAGNTSVSFSPKYSHAMRVSSPARE